jgi:hypothetical protein
MSYPLHPMSLYLSIIQKELPRSTALLEKLILDSQLVKKSPVLWNLNVYYHAQKSPPLDPMLSQMNPVHTITPCFIMIHLNIIILPKPIAPKQSLPSYLTKILYAYVVSSMRDICPTISFSLI